MSKGSTDTVIININTILGELPCKPSKSCIPKVESHFRCVGSDDIYEPQILSIGPYHHGNPRFQYMEQLKYKYLKRLLKRRKESVDRYVNAVAAMEERARHCYAETIKLDPNQFMTLLVFDGIFLVEFFRELRRYLARKLCLLFHLFLPESLRGENDPIFQDERRLAQLRRDIPLLENQLPMFVLHHLFKMTDTNDGVGSDGNDLIALALGLARCDVLFSLSVSPVWDDDNAADHLLGLIHDSLSLSFARMISPSSQNNGDIHEIINSVSGLMEAGVKFKKGDDNDNVMHIRFVKRMLIIPRLVISDGVESQLKNLIVYEQYLPEVKPRYVSDYAFIMLCLVKTSKYVELLCSHGIIQNYLGSAEEICQMFNRLGRNTMISSNFTYSQVFSNLNEHCGHRRYKMKADLSKNYFNSPWSFISFVAAAVLLILTIVQTIFAVLAYYYR